MPSYTPPLRDVRFVLSRLLELEVDPELVDAILEEAGRFTAEVIAPLNRAGDEAGCTRHTDGSVTTPPGYREAYRQYREAAWGTLALPEEHGGQGLPHVLATVVEEFLNSACHAFNMYPGLTHGAVSVLLDRGSEELKAAYLPKLVSGEWLGTMALPEAPEGTRGISLFVVPKILPDGSRNAVTCGAIEHKMGIRGSATCVLNFDGAAGWLVGDENQGLAAMFIMMNAARLSCGNQGLAQAELAYQNAAAHALHPRQGRAPGR